MRELGDGRTLVHCFGGCATADVLAAVGLEFDALYPERAIDHHVPRERAPFPATDVLRAVAGESHLVAIAASRVASGKPISATDAERVALAADRLLSARELLEDLDGRGMPAKRRHQYAEASSIAEAELREEAAPHE